MRKYWPILLALTLGLLASFHPTILSGFSRMQTDLGDTRLNNYLLEHTYRWVIRDPRHLSFFDPPFFYPVKGVAAFTDLALGAAPLYWFFRGIGLHPDSSMQAWMLGVMTLNFAAMAWLLARGLGFAPVPSALGAFLFAFGAPRITQIAHPQLLPHFFSVIAILAVTEFLGDRHRKLWISVFFLSFALQLYAGFYLGWFLGFGILIALVWVAAEPGRRTHLAAQVRREWKWIALNLSLFVMAVFPMGRAYLGAAQELGTREWSEVGAMVPRFRSWFYLGPESWIYGWIDHWNWGIPMAHEQRMGVGLITLGVALRGLWLLKREGRGGWGFGFVAIFLLSTSWFHDRNTLWLGVFHVVPGAEAIRAVSRIAMLSLIPLSIGLARYFSDHRTGAWMLLLVLCLAEQLTTPPSYDKAVARKRADFVAHQIGPRCEYFFYSPRIPPESFRRETPIQVFIQLDAMWAGVTVGRPTVNGYSGKLPSGWDFNIPIIFSSEDEKQIEELYQSWLRSTGIDPAHGCWVKPSVRFQIE
jgi:hypothetical protein